MANVAAEGCSLLMRTPLLNRSAAVNHLYREMEGNSILGLDLEHKIQRERLYINIRGYDETVVK